MCMGGQLSGHVFDHSLMVIYATTAVYKDAAPSKAVPVFASILCCVDGMAPTEDSSMCYERGEAHVVSVIIVFGVEQLGPRDVIIVLGAGQ